MAPNEETPSGDSDLFQGRLPPRPHDEVTTTALLAQIAHGNHAAFRQLYEMRSSRLYGLAMRITRQPTLASEALHDAFAQVWRNASRFNPMLGNGDAWLTSLVRYRAMDVMRNNRQHVFLQGWLEPLDTHLDALTQVQKESEITNMWVCFSALTDQRRQLIAMAFLDGLSHPEIAARLRLPIGTVKSSIRRSLIELKDCLSNSELD